MDVAPTHQGVSIGVSATGSFGGGGSGKRHPATSSERIGNGCGRGHWDCLASHRGLAITSSGKSTPRARYHPQLMNGGFKDTLYEQVARTGHALGNGHRLEILDLLCQGERSVEAVATQSRLSVASASQHLQVLHRARLVERRKVATQVLYRLAEPGVARLWISLRDLAAGRLPEIPALVASEFEGEESLEPVSLEELEKRLAHGEVTLVDVRPRLEFAAGHVAGAVSIPLDELEERIGSLRRDREVVAYCRGPYCVFSRDAVAKLRRRGFSARRMALGYPEWKLAGGPVEEGAA